jgi:hypothetical protein
MDGRPRAPPTSAFHDALTPTATPAPSASGVPAALANLTAVATAARQQGPSTGRQRTCWPSQRPGRRPPGEPKDQDKNDSKDEDEGRGNGEGEDVAKAVGYDQLPSRPPGLVGQDGADHADAGLLYRAAEGAPAHARAIAATSRSSTTTVP